MQHALSGRHTSLATCVALASTARVELAAARIALAVMADPLASLARAMEVVPDSEMEVAPVSSEVLLDSEE
uniref:Uncharacterized protein n=1 Tax=Oryza glumipatula TaxID=40148 RepID=A0A0D9ZIB7_9ORYZ